MLIGNVQLVQGTEASIPALLKVLEAEGFETEGNPDIEIRVYPQFLVADAREFVARTLTKSLGGARRVFIIVTANLTYEAQNTMLKTLEEPAGNALFFLVVPSPEALLPTVRSRAQILVLDGAAAEEKVDAAAFLHATPQKRLDMLKPLLDKGEDDVRDISSIVTFLSSLERTLSTVSPLPREGVEAVYRARKYAGDKGSLLKALLEQVALLAPRV
jgi:hypothetical protein